MILLSVYVFVASLIVWRTKNENKIFVAGMLFGIFLLFIPYNKLDGVRLWGYQIVINEYGTFGDFVGGIAATYFSGFAVYLLYLTYNSQRAELAATRVIMEAQSTMMNKQNDMLNRQNSVLVKEQFDNTFFNLLSSANEMTGEVTYNNASGRTLGKGIFRDIMRDFDRFNEQHRDTFVDLNIRDAFFREEQPNIALWSSRPYIQLISLLVELIENNVETNDRSKYFNIILSTLNTRQFQFIREISNTASHNIARIDQLKKLVSINPNS